MWGLHTPLEGPSEGDHSSGSDWTCVEVCNYVIMTDLKQDWSAVSVSQTCVISSKLDTWPHCYGMVGSDQWKWPVLSVQWKWPVDYPDQRPVLWHGESATEVTSVQCYDMENQLRKASSVQFLTVEEPTFSLFRLQRCLSFAGEFHKNVTVTH